MRQILLASLLTIFFLPRAAALEPYDTDTLAFVGVNVIPMTENTVLPNQTVIVKDGHIEQIGPAADIRIPRRATEIDANGAFLMPGLIDLHAHFFGGRDGNVPILQLYLSQGVTTVLNMRGMRGVLELRDEVLVGTLLGPRIYSASPILGNVSPTPSSYEKAQEMVTGFHEDGYDFIKVYNFIPPEGYRGVIDTARKYNIPVVGHTVRSVGLDAALESGQHIAHMEEIIYGAFDDGLDESKIPELAQRIKESGVSIIATLIVYHNIIHQVNDIEAMLAAPGVEYLPERLLGTWQPDRNEYLQNTTPEEVESGLIPTFAFQQKLTRAFHEAGVPILLGTDACVPVTVPGYSAHQELQELVDAGLSPYDALAAGTSRAAQFLEPNPNFGTIQTGKRADFILLDKNPLENIANSNTIRGICVRGKWMDQEAIRDELLVH